NRRLTAMADMMISDPKRASELAAPKSLRETLPQPIRDLIELPVNGQGDLEVIGVLGNGGGSVPPVVRFANVDGMRAQAFTFDEGLRFVTRHGVRLNGYAVPSSFATTPPANPLASVTNIILITPTPARPLEGPEIPQYTKPLASEPICSA